MIQFVFAKIRYYKDKVASCRMGILQLQEVNQLKNFCSTVFRFLFLISRMQIFHIYDLKTKWQN